MESLEVAQARTQKFIAFVRDELKALGLDVGVEPFIDIAEKVIPVLTAPAEHYELREQVAGSFSSAAYKYLTDKWKQVPL